MGPTGSYVNEYEFCNFKHIFKQQCVKQQGKEVFLNLHTALSLLEISIGISLRAIF